MENVWLDIKVQFQDHVFNLAQMEIGDLFLVLVMVFCFTLIFKLFLFFKTKIESIDIDECVSQTYSCGTNTICSNTIGSYECHCKPGYYGDGIECFPCDENEYSFNYTICLSCPENTTSLLASPSIMDCKCTLFNYYLDISTSTCLPCPLGFLIDDSNTCRSSFSFFLSFSIVSFFL